ncbi:hypothetical protein Tco_0308223 [Tanacetum coccineum]
MIRIIATHVSAIKESVLPYVGYCMLSDDVGYCMLLAFVIQRINILRGEVKIVCEEKFYFVEELKTVKAVITLRKVMEFLNGIQGKDD